MTLLDGCLRGYDAYKVVHVLAGKLVLELYLDLYAFSNQLLDQYSRSSSRTRSRHLTNMLFDSLSKACSRSNSSQRGETIPIGSGSTLSVFQLACGQAFTDSSGLSFRP